MWFWCCVSFGKEQGAGRPLQGVRRPLPEAVVELGQVGVAPGQFECTPENRDIADLIKSGRYLIRLDV